MDDGIARAKSGTDVADEGALRAIYPPVTGFAKIKTLTALDKHCRAFIARSPFLCLGTSRADGAADVSPRGDPPGFVKVLDDRTLALPDRPGNNLLDSLSNVVSNPQVGLLFFVPGVEETLRVNGVGRVSTEPGLLASMAVDGKLPRAALVIEVREAFLHCAKALKRGRLWGEDYKVARKELPTLGQMLVDQVKTTVTAGEADQRIDEAYRTKLY